MLTADILRAAATRARERGVLVGHFGTEDGPNCGLGHIFHAATDVTGREYCDWARVAAREAVAAYLHLPDQTAGAVDPFAVWSDAHPDEVPEVFEKAAAAIEELA